MSTNMNVGVDVCTVVDAVRGFDTLKAAMSGQGNIAMRTLRRIIAHGTAAGVTLWSSGHIDQQIRKALRATEDSDWGGVTRNPWAEADIAAFVELFHHAVVRSGGRYDLEVLHHDSPRLERIVAKYDIPCREDAQVFHSVVVKSPATMLVTSDNEFRTRALTDLLPGDRFVEMAPSSVLHDEVKANVFKGTKVLQSA